MAKAKVYQSSQNDAIATAATFTALNGDFQGGVATLTVPGDAMRISEVIVGASQDGGASDNTVIGIQISGTGIKDGTHQMVVAGCSNAGTVAGDGRVDMAITVPVSIGVKPSSSYNVSAAMVSDVGSVAVGVTLAFELTSEISVR